MKPSPAAYDPWRDAAERHAELHVEVCTTSPISGAWVRDAAVVFIGRHLDPVQRRCTLAHELAHVDLVHSATGQPILDARLEVAADALAAARLIPLPELIAAAPVYPDDPAGLASCLCVTERVLQLRVARLDRPERAALEAALARLEVAA
jgi:Zn-dependent peptidase ImmA (M78 family)